LGLVILFSGKLQWLREYLPSRVKPYFFSGGIRAQLLDNIRRELWSISMAAIRDHPLWGLGKDGYLANLAFYVQQTGARKHILTGQLPPHNSYLAWMVYWGVPSFLWVVALVLRTIQWGGRRWRDARVCVTLMALLAVMIHAVYHEIIGARIFWIALATASYAAKHSLSEEPA